MGKVMDVIAEIALIFAIANTSFFLQQSFKNTLNSFLETMIILIFAVVYKIYFTSHK